jgi:hypothetical protein
MSGHFAAQGRPGRSHGALLLKTITSGPDGVNEKSDENE